VDIARGPALKAGPTASLTHLRATTLASVLAGAALGESASSTRNAPGARLALSPAAPGRSDAVTAESWRSLPCTFPRVNRFGLRWNKRLLTANAGFNGSTGRL
jgi:hypothetical protein